LVGTRHGSGTYVQRVRGTALRKPLQLFVAQHDVGIADLFMIRMDLEGAVGFHAASQADDQDLDQLHSNLAVTKLVLRQMQRDPKDAAAMEAFAWADLSFHQTLAAATHNPLYEAILTPFVDTLLEVRRQGVRVASHTARYAIEDHEEIYRAILPRNPDQARQLMIRHLARVEAWVPREEPVVPTAKRNGSDTVSPFEEQEAQP